MTESLDVLKRTINNGGNAEETAVIDNNNNPTRGIAATRIEGNLSMTDLPNVPGDNNTSIHSHVPLEPSVNAAGNIVYSSALKPGPADPAAFSKFKLNIIVGRLGTQTGTADIDGKVTFDKKPTLGAAFYRRGEIIPTLQLTIKAIEKIIK